MDSTETLDMPGLKVFILLTNSCYGSLPVGVVMTTVDSEDAIVGGLQMINDLVMERSWGGRGIYGPLFFITDDSSTERAAIRRVFPETKLLLSQYHVLRAAWRFVWKNESNIDADDRQTLFHLFKTLVYETDADVFAKVVDESSQNEHIKKYPMFVEYMEDALIRKEDWATCFRSRLLFSRGQNISNICDSSDANMRVSAHDFAVNTESYRCGLFEPQC